MEPHRPPITTTNVVTAAVALVVVAIAIIALVAMPWGEPTVSEMERDVWTSLLLPNEEAWPLILEPETVSLEDEPLSLLRIDWDRRLAQLDPEIREGAIEASVDFRRKNARRWPIANDFPPEAHVRVMTPEEVRAFRTEDGPHWPEFYRMFAGGKDHGAIWVLLSRVGFSRNGTWAIVLIDQMSGGKSGVMELLLLRWTGSAWEREEILVQGIS
ncbi:MAG: hypothetical protein ABFS86_10865 [Planctomycetota bacterium]